MCDCVHCIEPLTIKPQPFKDVQIRGVGYDRRLGRQLHLVSSSDMGETDVPILETRFNFDVSSPYSCFVEYYYASDALKDAVRMANDSYGLGLVE